MFDFIQISKALFSQQRQKYEMHVELENLRGGKVFVSTRNIVIKEHHVWMNVWPFASVAHPGGYLKGLRFCWNTLSLFEGIKKSRAVLSRNILQMDPSLT